MYQGQGTRYSSSPCTNSDDAVHLSLKCIVSGWIRDRHLQDHAGAVLSDDTFMQLVNYPNVILSGHQAFLTEEVRARIYRCAFAWKNASHADEKHTC